VCVAKEVAYMSGERKSFCVGAICFHAEEKMTICGYVTRKKRRKMFKEGGYF
jgi:hypothetical protein